MSSDTRVTSIRLPAKIADDVDFVARVEGVTAAEVMRQALAEHLKTRRNDAAFQARVAERLEADRQILNRLAE